MQSEVVLKKSGGENSGYKVFGKHVYGDVVVRDSALLADEEALKEIVKDAAMVGNMTLLDIKSWKIGLGVSIMALVLESHITVHTWPEHSYATIDVYSCGAHTNPELAFNYITERLGAVEVKKNVIDRSLV